MRTTEKNAFILSMCILKCFCYWEVQQFSVINIEILAFTSLLFESIDCTMLGKQKIEVLIATFYRSRSSTDDHCVDVESTFYSLVKKRILLKRTTLSIAFRKSSERSSVFIFPFLSIFLAWNIEGWQPIQSAYQF